MTRDADNSWSPEGGNRPHHGNRVWQLGKSLSVELYEITAEFPDHEKFGLSSQLRRAGVSVPSNVAEGKARGSDGQLLRFLYMARGSLEEIDTQMEIADELGYLARLDVTRAQELFENLSRALEGLIRKVQADTA